MPISRTGDGAREQGFTLLELLIVLAIIGIVTAVTGQLVMHRLPGIRVDAGSAAVAAVFREGRSVAIRDNHQQSVVIDVDARSLRIGSDGREHQLQSDIGISLLTASSELKGERGVIRFFPDGTSTGGRVRLFADARVNEIIVHWLTGHVEIRKDVQ